MSKFRVKHRLHVIAQPHMSIGPSRISTICFSQGISQTEWSLAHVINGWCVLPMHEHSELEGYIQCDILIWLPSSRELKTTLAAAWLAIPQMDIKNSLPDRMLTITKAGVDKISYFYSHNVFFCTFFI